jgi:hypothetical protein
MPEYRFYAVEIDGHVNGPAVTLEFPGDGPALKEAKRLVNGHDIEVWQDTRLVAYVIPEDATYTERTG